MDNYTKIFPTAPGLDQDLGSVGIMLDSCNKEMSNSMDLSDYYTDNDKPIGRFYVNLTVTFYLLTFFCVWSFVQ